MEVLMTIFPTTEVYPYTLVDATEVPVCVPDISTWQGDVDADKFIAAGAHGVIMRAGAVSAAGSCYTDYQFEANAAKFDGRLPMGAYWFYRPEHDPVVQAEYFANLLDGYVWHIPPVVDVEYNTTGVSVVNFQNWLYKFLLRLEALDFQVPMIYTRGTFWNPNVGNPAYAPNYSLWVARYSTYLIGPWSDGNYRPLPWQDWLLWQWSADGNRRGAEFGVQSADIDLNRFNGSLPDFYAWCNWNQEPPPEPPEEPCDCLQHVIDFWDRIKKSGDDILAAWRN
jgi:lysozyme